MVSSVNEVMLKDNMPKKKDVIAEAKEYIRHKTIINISLNDISGKFYINPYYFSQLFKKKTGMTYQKYLTDYHKRIVPKSCWQRRNCIFMRCVRKAVGYSDVNHFNQTFERVEGMKPSEYRQKYKQEEN